MRVVAKAIALFFVLIAVKIYRRRSKSNFYERKLTKYLYMSVFFCNFVR